MLGTILSPHKEQADLFAQFYESLAIPSNEEHFDNDHLEDCEYRYSLINNIVQHTANESFSFLYGSVLKFLS
jgi:hypothetical protein